MSNEYNFCTKCGSKIQDGHNFCSNCGFSIKNSAATKSKEPTNINNRNNHKNKKISKNTNSNKNNKKTSKGNKIIQVLGLLMFLFILFIVLVPSSSKETIEVSPSTKYQTFTTKEGVSINLPPYIISKDEKLTVTYEENNDKDSNVLKTVDVTLGDHHNLNSFIEITIPFDRLNIQNYSAENVLEVYSTNPETKEKEVELSEINKDSITVYTDHLSSFELRQVPLGEKIRKSEIGTLSRDDCLKVLNAIDKGSAVDTSMTTLGFNSINDTITWANNFTTFASAIKEVPFLEDNIYNNLSLMGNTLFYITVAKDMNTAIMTGDTTSLVDNIKANGLGYIIGFASNPYIKAAYTSYQVVNYLGAKLDMAIDSEAHAKYVYAYEEVYQEKVIGPYKDKYGSTWKSAWYRDWYNKFKTAANQTSSSEEFNLEIERLIKEVTLVPVSSNYQLDFDAYAADYYNQKQTEDRGFLGNIVKSIESTYNDEQENALIKSKTLQLLSDMRPVLRNLSNNLLTKAEQGYYKAFAKIQNDINTPYTITIKTTDKIPKNTEGIFELTSDSKTVYESSVDNDNPHVIEMSLSDYFELGKPNNARIVLISNEVNTIEKPFNFKLENQILLFETPKLEDVNLDSTNQENENTNAKDNINNTQNNYNNSNNLENTDLQGSEDIKKSEEYKNYILELDYYINLWREKLKKHESKEIIKYHQEELDSIIELKKDNIDFYESKEKQDDYTKFKIEVNQLYIDIANQYRETGIDNITFEIIKKEYENMTPPNSSTKAVAFLEEFAPLQSIHASIAVKETLEYAIDIANNKEYGITKAHYDSLMNNYKKRSNSPIKYTTLPYETTIALDEEPIVYEYLLRIGNLFENFETNSDFLGNWNGEYIIPKENINWDLYNSITSAKLEDDGSIHIIRGGLAALSGEKYDLEEELYMEVENKNGEYIISDQDSASTYSFSGNTIYYETVDLENEIKMSLTGTISKNTITGKVHLNIRGQIAGRGTFKMIKTN